jgi:hypothetical protein
VQVAPAGQPYHAVSQLLSLEQDHDHKNKDQPGHCQWLKQWSDNVPNDL